MEQNAIIGQGHANVRQAILGTIVLKNVHLAGMVIAVIPDVTVRMEQNATIYQVPAHALQGTMDPIVEKNAHLEHLV